MEAGKTFIKYKDVKIGQVTGVALYQDYSKVMVTARIDKQAEGLMVDDARFWVVQPRVTLSGVSGLGTLLAGNYIGFERGTSTVADTDFIGLEKAPFVAGRLGHVYTLKADSLGSLAAGSPVHYRFRWARSSVSSSRRTASGRIQVFVSTPTTFVSLGTRFWRGAASGHVDRTA